MGKRGGVIAVVAVLAVVAVGAILAASLWSTGDPSADPTPSPSGTATPSPTASPTPAGPPPDGREHTVGDLPAVNVHAVIGELPVDDAPQERTLGITARPADGGAPVYADPAGDPVAWMHREETYHGTSVPVIEKHDHWVKVLLVGRQARAGDGDPSQLSGWMRTADVGLTDNAQRVEVDLDARTIDIVTAEGDDETRETIATDFAWGADATPTPVGRSFVMLQEEEVSFPYTRGHPMIYLSVQSPTLPGFSGQTVAVTAFHYHDVRTGAISNGCIRVDADVAERLYQLPEGTPVHIV
ncbi:L,D-transpeptidase [Microbacterium sp. G2-8]|uniref:L,D-transpeptidase n=1 Tax=Microbacterium sp. G2-8 TaxID=2842454 RepID=UPI001C8A22D7|nr:L,D-transpeptidase [Microbacterium sp. G2-8]